MTVALFREVCFELGAWVHDNHLGHPENALPRIYERLPDNLWFFRAVSNQRVDHLKSCAPTDSVQPEVRLSVELLFDKVDTEAWDSNWDEGWGESTAVFANSDSTHVPEAVQDDVEWGGNSEDPSQPVEDSNDLPTEAAMKRMKKAELVALAQAHGVDDSGTKADIISRLLA